MNYSLIRHFYKVTFLIFLINVVSYQLRAQDPIFSQFYNAPIQLNPAFAGNSTSPLVTINYRNQWPNWGPKAFATYSASYDQFFEALNSGFGLQILTDNQGAGILKTNRISGVYAYRVKFRDELQAKIGIEAAFTQSRLNWDKLVFLDQLDPRNFVSGGGSLLPTSEIRPVDLSRNYFDISAGLLLFSPTFYGGLTLKHLSAPQNEFIEDPSNINRGLPLRFSAHAGYTLDLGGSNNDGFGTFLAPSIMLVRQSDFSQLNAGALFNKESFFGGAWFRYTFSNADAVIVSFGWRTELFKMSYSFDFTVSGASVLNSGGSHEFGIVINFGADENSDSKYNDCFKLFR